MSDEQTILNACKSLHYTLHDGTEMPRLGQGTWHIGDDPHKRADEIAALRYGIELGMTLIDTAEDYGLGRSEQLIGEAISSYDRAGLFLVSKVYPHNAGGRKLVKSCEDSLKRLGTDYLDLYLLHWRGDIPFSETVEGLEKLKAQGKIRNWGVSNLDTADMKELWEIPSGNRCVANQLLYHLGERGIEYDLLPWQAEHKIPTMAYCPIAQAGSLRQALLNNTVVNTVAQKYDATAIQILLAFLLYHDQIIAIPKSGTRAHTLENAKAALIKLSSEDYDALSSAFPAPQHKTRLEII